MSDELDRITALLSRERLVQTLMEIVNIPSPTGQEAPLALHIAKSLSAAGVPAQTQRLDDTQANAWARLAGSGGGRRLLLYAPLDTVTSNSAMEDVPWVGPALRPDMQATAELVDDHVFGLGAHNPKGHVACVMEAARILATLGIPLAGDIYFGFGAGGMPTHARNGLRPGCGHGAGCAALLSELPAPDGAIVAKSGLAVTWAEVGFIWLEVRVSGTHSYVGSRHLLPYRSTIADASRLILKLEDWFERRAASHATALVRPQGVVSFIESGWERMPAFTPAVCRFLVDLRFGPDMTADEADAEFAAVLDAFRAELGIEANYTRVQTIEASLTNEQDPVIRTTIASWEAIHRRPHVPFTLMSGSTDANIIRQHGIPTARMGLPKARLPDIDFQLGMNCASVADMEALTKVLALTALRYCAGATHG